MKFVYIYGVTGSLATKNVLSRKVDNLEIKIFRLVVSIHFNRPLSLGLQKIKLQQRTYSIYVKTLVIALIKIILGKQKDLYRVVGEYI